MKNKMCKPVGTALEIVHKIFRTCKRFETSIASLLYYFIFVLLNDGEKKPCTSAVL